MSITTPTSGARRMVAVGDRLLEISNHVREDDRWGINGDETSLPVALRRAPVVPFKKAQSPHERAYDADEVRYYSPTNCVFIIKGGTVVTITPANRSSLDLSSLVQCETCDEWTDLRGDGTNGFRCAYCDSKLTALNLTQEVNL